MMLISNGAVSRHNARGTLLGAFANLDYGEVDLVLFPGDRAVLYTDGLVEGKESEGYETGVERLSKILVQSSVLPLRQWVDNTLDHATAQVGALNLSDDITLVALEVL